jgi:phage gp36-like protein
VAYSTRTDLEEKTSKQEVVKLAAITGTQQGIGNDTDAVNKAIADADGVIDGFIEKQYSLALVKATSPVPPLLVQISASLALYNLRQKKPGDPERFIRFRDDAMALLKKIGAGDMSLGVTSEDVGGESSIQITHEKTDRVFTRKKTSDSFSGTLDNY